MKRKSMVHWLLSISLFFSLFLGLSPGLRSQTRVPGQAPDSSSVDSAKAKRLKILHADLLTFEQKDGVGIQKLIGNVRLQQDSTLFFCKRAFFYEAENRIEAFEAVRVEMADSVFLFGDRMKYEGDTKIAEVYDNITLTNQQSVLTTDRLTFYREEDYAYYQEGGKLVDDESVLTSEYGYYYPNQDMAYFKQDVELLHPDYTLHTDTLGYNTRTKVAVFLTLTDILSKDGEIQTTGGTYDTRASRVRLTERSALKDSAYILYSDSLDYIDEENVGIARGNVLVVQEDSSMEIRGNYGRFKRDTDESMVTGEAVAIQFFEDDTLFIFADTLFSTKIKRLIPRILPDTLPTDSLLSDSLALLIGQADSTQLDSASNKAEDSTTEPNLIVNAALPYGPPLPQDSVWGGEMIVDPDRIEVPDSLDLLFPNPPLPPLPTSPIPADSSLMTGIELDSTMAGPPLPPPPGPPMDTLEIRVFRAYHNVRFFMNDMQGRADSMVYFYDDSLIYLYADPVLWSEENQLSGDTVAVWMKNSKADSMWVGNHGFLVSQEDTVGFNQIKGTELRAKFLDNQIHWLHVIGSSESIYFIKDEEDSVQTTYQGMNESKSQEMKIFFEENEVQKILFLKQPEGIFHPFFEVALQENRLDGMRWRIQERPERPQLFAPNPESPPLKPDLPALEEEIVPKPTDGEGPSLVRPGEVPKVEEEK